MRSRFCLAPRLQARPPSPYPARQGRPKPYSDALPDPSIRGNMPFCLPISRGPTPLSLWARSKFLLLECSIRLQDLDGEIAFMEGHRIRYPWCAVRFTDGPPFRRNDRGSGPRRNRTMWLGFGGGPYFGSGPLRRGSGWPREGIQGHNGAHGHEIILNHRQRGQRLAIK